MQRNSKLGAVFCAALAIPLLSCGGGSRHDVEEAYYLVTTNKSIPYWQSAAAGLTDAATKLGVKFELVATDAYDPNGEKTEFKKLLSRPVKPTGILVSPADPEGMAPLIDEAVAQGIPVVTIDTDAPASKRLLFIGTNNYEAGRMGGEVVAKALNGKGNVVVFTMPGQVNLRERLNGYEQVFRANPGIKIVEVVDMKGDPRITFDRTKEILDSGTPAVDAFVCLEAQSCPEVADVVSRHTAKNKLIVGMDTDPRTLDWIRKGVIAATIAQKPYTMAYFGTQVLDSLYHNKLEALQADFKQDARAPLPSLVDTGATLVDKSNVDSFRAGETQKAN